MMPFHSALYTPTVFGARVDSSARLVRLTAADVQARSSLLSAAREEVSRSESLYPGIEAWFSRRVIPGICNGTRVVDIALQNNVAVGIGVLRRDQRPKLCHLRIDPTHFSRGVGSRILGALLATLPVEVRVGFTASESVWVQVSPFFNHLGVQELRRRNVRGRAAGDEIVFELPARWARAVLMARFARIPNSQILTTSMRALPRISV